MAIINIGSGSVKLYLEKTRTTEATVTLLASYAGKNDLTALDDTYNAVAFFCQKAADCGESVRIFGTESMRRVDSTLASRIFDRLGLRVDIISGDDEALCGFLGCADDDCAVGGIDKACDSDCANNRADSGGANSNCINRDYAVGGIDNACKSDCLKNDCANMAVIDVGGASTELSVGSHTPTFCISLPIGSVALYNRFGVIHNPNDSFLPDLYNYIDSILADINIKNLPPIGKIKLIGGGATNLAAILQNLQVFDAAAVNGYSISRSVLPTLIEQIFNTTIENRVATHPFLEPKRALVIPYGIAIIYRLLTLLPNAQTTISTSGLIEGYLKLKPNL